MQFFDDLLAIKQAGLLPRFPHLQKAGLVFFHLPPLMDCWLKILYAQMDDPVIIKTAMVRDFLKKQTGFMGLNVNRKIKGKVYRCVVFSAGKAPAELLEILND